MCYFIHLIYARVCQDINMIDLVSVLCEKCSYTCGEPCVHV